MQFSVLHFSDGGIFSHLSFVHFARSRWQRSNTSNAH